MPDDCEQDDLVEEPMDYTPMGPPGQTVVEWRARATGHRHAPAYNGAWTTGEDIARYRTQCLAASLDPWAEVWLERRTVVYSEPERVT